MTFLEQINDLLWGLPLIILLMGTHIYFTCRLRFPQRNLFRAIRLSLLSAEDMSSAGDSSAAPKAGRNLSPFSALSTTLAATLGTGNIIGVSTAVALGGPGAIFWCWITGILGMATAYGECYLSVRYRQRKEDGLYVGGPMYVLKNGLHNKTLGSLYALCTLAAAFGVGCTTQANSVTRAANLSFGISPHPVGIALAVITGAVILGGIRSIGNLCERTVPAITFLYLFGCVLLLCLYRHQLVTAVVWIIKDAFSFTSLAGGVAGASLQRAMRYGIARGLFTNEAGIGTSAIAAAASHTEEPRIQAYVSMTAVFWDTVVMCLLTGLVVVCNMLYDPASTAGAAETDLTAAAFSHLPYVGDAFLTISLCAFAVTTLIGWSYFGEKAAEYLGGNHSVPLYKLLYIVMIYLGAIIPMHLVWECTDLINGLMALPNLLALWALRREIKS
ncbi:MAG: sodium:alanine symporter family protein [Lachnospiraceae bacterium]|nr:sodium:alanine symporter family protein [Lachnospiraceae bacterium]